MAREGGQRPGARALLRELKEQIRGEVWKGPHHVGTFFIREALLQVKREGLEQETVMPGMQATSKKAPKTTLRVWGTAHSES